MDRWGYTSAPTLYVRAARERVPGTKSERPVEAEFYYAINRRFYSNIMSLYYSYTIVFLARPHSSRYHVPQSEKHIRIKETISARRGVE